MLPLSGAEITQVAQGEGYYRFTLALPAGGGGCGAQTWMLGAHTNDERRDWLEALLNASRCVQGRACASYVFLVAWSPPRPKTHTP